VALFREGEEEAFRVIHDRYRQRLFTYVRQMLGPSSRQEAEDVLQDVFVRAYGALRADRRPVLLRAWLYRVAHNRCVDVLRRPVPAPAEVFEVSRKPLHDPIEEAQRREDLERLVHDVARLPGQQRSALLMREIDGLPYVEISAALGVTVPAVKSLLVRARMGLVEAQEARELDCSVVRRELLEAYDRGVKSPARARRHLRDCSGCREYRRALRGMRRSFAALYPVGLAPAALAAKALGVGSAGGGAAAGGSAAGGAAAMTGGGLATATACKVAAVVCTAAIGAGGAVEMHKLVREKGGIAARSVPAASAPAATVPVAAHEHEVERTRRSVATVAAPAAVDTSGTSAPQVPARSLLPAPVPAARPPTAVAPAAPPAPVAPVSDEAPVVPGEALPAGEGISGSETEASAPAATSPDSPATPAGREPAAGSSSTTTADTPPAAP
jgi:RNA polymerase sigma factor (sigma-70 family)